MDGNDLSTTIGRATGSAGFDENGNQIYRNKNIVNLFLSLLKWIFNKIKLIHHLNFKESASDKAKRKANREIKEMAERLSADQSIIVSLINILIYIKLDLIILNFIRIRLNIYFTLFIRIN